MIALELKEKEFDIEKKRQVAEWEREFKIRQLESQERIELARIEAEKARAQAQEKRDGADIERD
jgi:hypothetical protein